MLLRSTEAAWDMTLQSDLFLVEISGLLGYYHFLCQSDPKMPALFSSVSSRITFPPIFPGHFWNCILLVDVEMFPASFKTAGNGEAFYGNADTTLSYSIAV